MMISMIYSCHLILHVNTVAETSHVLGCGSNVIIERMIKFEEPIIEIAYYG